jgi:AcrR family transcriptional regulator
MKELLQEKSFDKITVNDICDKALVHRATFYNHFSDKNELLNFVFDEMQEEMYRSTKDLTNCTSIKEMYVIAISKIFDYVLKNKESIRLILKNSTQGFQLILSETLRRGLNYLIEKNKDANNFDCSNTGFIIAFFTGGISELCVDMVLSDEKIDKAGLMKYFEKILDVTLNEDF